MAFQLELHIIPKCFHVKRLDAVNACFSSSYLSTENKQKTCITMKLQVPRKLKSSIHCCLVFKLTLTTPTEMNHMPVGLEPSLYKFTPCNVIVSFVELPRGSRIAEGSAPSKGWELNNSQIFGIFTIGGFLRSFFKLVCHVRKINLVTEKQRKVQSLVI